MKHVLGWMLLAASLALVTVACSDDDGDGDGRDTGSDSGADTGGDTGGGDTGGGDTGGGDTGGGDMGGGDTGGGDTGGGDTGGGDTGGGDTGGGDTGGGDTGGGDMGGGDMGGGDMGGGDMGGGDTGSSECEIATDGVTWDDSQIVVIEAVRFAPDSGIRVRNVSGETLTVGANTWTIGLTIPTTQTLPAFSIPAGGSIWIHTQRTGTNSATELFLGLSDTPGNRADAASDEIELFSAPKSSGPFDSTTIETFVRWGTAPPSGTTASMADDATTAGFWTDDEFVAGTSEALGILATGDVTTAAGYTVLTDDSCF